MAQCSHLLCRGQVRSVQALGPRAQPSPGGGFAEPDGVFEDIARGVSEPFDGAGATGGASRRPIRFGGSDGVGLSSSAAWRCWWCISLPVRALLPHTAADQLGRLARLVLEPGDQALLPASHPGRRRPVRRRSDGLAGGPSLRAHHDSGYPHKDGPATFEPWRQAGEYSRDDWMLVHHMKGSRAPLTVNATITTGDTATYRLVKTKAQAQQTHLNEVASRRTSHAAAHAALHQAVARQLRADGLARPHRPRRTTPTTLRTTGENGGQAPALTPPADSAAPSALR